MAALAVLATVAVFHRVPWHGFLEAWDDDVQVYANRNLKPPTIESVARFWNEPFEHLYIPLTYTAYAALATLAAQPPRPGPAPAEGTAKAGIGDFDPRVFHAANLALHAASVVLLFLILLRLCGDQAAAALGALLFGVHPMQVESVAWISELKGILAGFLSLLALWQYALAVEPLAARRPGPVAQKHYLFAGAAFAAALFAKPTAVTVPLLAAIVERLIVRRPWKETAMRLGPWLAGSFLMIHLTSDAQFVSRPIITPLTSRPLIAGDALAFYLRQLVLPLHLGPDYGREPTQILAQDAVRYVWLAPAAVAAALFALRRRAPWLGAGGLLFLGALLPVSGLVAFNYQVYSTVADRYAYIALAGIGLALAFALARAGRFRRAALGAAGAVVLAFGVRSEVQTRYWSDTVTLFHHALDVNPQSWVSHNNLGTSFYAQRRYHEALREFLASLKIRPTADMAWSNAGMILGVTGKLDEAATALKQALALKPGFIDAHNNLAVVYAKQGRKDEALAEWNEVLRIDPKNSSAAGNIAALRSMPPGAKVVTNADLDIPPPLRGATAGTIVAVPRGGGPATVVDPAGAPASTAPPAGRAPGEPPQQRTPAQVAAEDAFNRGLALERQGREALALAAYAEAVGFDPAHAPARNNLGILLGRQGRIDEAIDHFREGLLIAPQNSDLHANLGTALASKGRTEEAIAEFRLALALRPGAPDVTFNLGMSLRSAGRDNEALPLLREAVRRDGHYAETLRRAGLGPPVLGD